MLAAHDLAEIASALIRAEGPAFCAGRDITTAELGEDPVQLMRAAFNVLVLKIHGLPIPTVSAVQGACIGAGTGIALAWDRTVVSDDAKIGSPFGRLGAVPDSGFHWFITTRFGPAVTRELLLTGVTADFEEGLSAFRTKREPHLDGI